MQKFLNHMVLLILLFCSCDNSSSGSGSGSSPDYRVDTGKIINHTNFDPSGYSDSQITAAAALKVYFEHASTGQDIVGDSNGSSSTGVNFDGSATCGLALLYVQNNRYLCDRNSLSSGNDSNWFASHTGLQSNNRGNPAPATKRRGFTSLSANMRSAVDVTFFKYCWIDVWSSISGYYSDGVAAANTDIAALENFMSGNPGVVVPYVTMPLQSNESYAAREAYNATIRTHCANYKKWLLDMADIECYNDAGVKQTDGNGREIAAASYVIIDGGHLSADGRLKMAKAYWSLLAEIAAN